MSELEYKIALYQTLVDELEEEIFMTDDPSISNELYTELLKYIEILEGLGVSTWT